MTSKVHPISNLRLFKGHPKCGWGIISVNEMLVIQEWQSKFDSQNQVKEKQGMVACTGEAETWGPLAYLMSSSPIRDLVPRKHLRSNTWVCLLVSKCACTHIHNHPKIHTQELPKHTSGIVQFPWPCVLAVGCSKFLMQLRLGDCAFASLQQGFSTHSREGLMEQLSSWQWEQSGWVWLFTSWWMKQMEKQQRVGGKPLMGYS